MSLVVTEAIVLHAFDYLETSRILRFVTREAGVQSAIAKGARRSRARFGSAVDLFAEGEAQIYVKPSRELHTMASFDVVKSRAVIAADIDRFVAASAVAELVLRLGHAEPNPELYDAVAGVLDAIGQASGDDVTAATLAGLWRIVAASGFTPILDSCANCRAPIAPVADAVFSAAAGGALCDRCARTSPGHRRLPAGARATLGRWLAAEPTDPVDTATARAHRRLLREFLTQHLADDRPLKAFATWETGMNSSHEPRTERA